MTIRPVALLLVLLLPEAACTAAPDRTGAVPVSGAYLSGSGGWRP